MLKVLGDAGNVFIQDQTIADIANTYVADAVGWIVLVAAVAVFAALGCGCGGVAPGWGSPTRPRAPKCSAWAPSS